MTYEVVGDCGVVGNVELNTLILYVRSAYVHISMRANLQLISAAKFIGITWAWRVA